MGGSWRMEDVERTWGGWWVLCFFIFLDFFILSGDIRARVMTLCSGIKRKGKGGKKE